MEAGARDRYVTIQQVTDGVDASDFPEESWSTLCQMWASKEDIGGRERFSANQTTAPFDTRWQVNYRADIDPELVSVSKVRRVLYQGRVHDIVRGSQIGRREGVELLTLARQG